MMMKVKHLSFTPTLKILSLFTKYSLCFKIKVTFGYKLRYEIKVMFGENSFKLRQTNWNVAKINVNDVVDELPSQITIYTCLTVDIWTQ